LDNQINVSVSPHLKDNVNITKIMHAVNISLIPAVIASIYLFGLKSFIVILISVISCLIFELFSQIVFKRKITIYDGSAIVTGILLAFNLPPTIPWWMVIVGAFFAIFIVKQLFGGLGYNIFNPALAARAALLACFPVQMTTWTMPVRYLFNADAIAAATSDVAATASPLAIVKMKLATPLPSYLDMFLGNIPGSLGETCKLALLIGALFLLLLRVINLRIPLSYILTVFVMSFLFGRDPFFEILAGGLILGAFFMATDMVTAPTSKAGEIVFGIGCGLIASLIRRFGGFPEGVCYSILLMNCVVPLLEKYIRPRKFGAIRGGKN